MFLYRESFFLGFFEYFFADAVWIETQDRMARIAFHVLMMMICIIELICFASFRKRDTTNDPQFQKEWKSSEYAGPSNIHKMRSYFLSGEYVGLLHEWKYIFSFLSQTLPVLFQ